MCAFIYKTVCRRLYEILWKSSPEETFFDRQTYNNPIPPAALGRPIEIDGNISDQGKLEISHSSIEFPTDSFSHQQKKPSNSKAAKNPIKSGKIRYLGDVWRSEPETRENNSQAQVYE